MRTHTPYIFLLLLLLFSCRKDVRPEIPDYTQKVVIEGSIETGSAALVFLSYSIPYFGEFDFSSPEKAFIKGALVTVSDGITTDTLRELDPNTGYIYTGSKLIGAEGRVYTINVTVNNKNYETQSRILTPVRLDTVYFINSSSDSLGYLGQMFKDPEGRGDCYRWFAKRLNRDLFYSAPLNSVFDDKFIDGQYYGFTYNRGIQPNPFGEYTVDLERGYYKRGDTVVVKFCRIGRREYDFWFTYYQTRNSNSNPFSAPANIKSMFENYHEAFGSFVAYAPVFDTIIIP